MKKLKTSEHDQCNHVLKHLNNVSNLSKIQEEKRESRVDSRDFFNKDSFIESVAARASLA